MPTLFLPVPDTIQSVVRPVVYQIVKDIQEMTRIPPNTTIIYPGDIEVAQQPGSAISDNEMDRVSAPATNRVFIEVTEENDPASILTTAVAQAEHLPIFYDDKIGVYMKPVYGNAQMNISFRFRGSSKSSVLRWRDSIRAKTSAGRDVNVHKTPYSYVIPHEYFYILEEIHRLREANAGYGDSFAEYIVTHANTRLTELSDIAGHNTVIGVSETQARVVGGFDFEGQPEKGSKVGNSDIWEINFNYKFTFDKPIGVVLRYPVMIHNQVLSEDFRPNKPAPDDNVKFQTYSLSANAFEWFEKPRRLDRSIDPNATLTIPWFDEFIPRTIPPGTISIMNILLSVYGQTKLEPLMNVRDLGDVAIDKHILHFLIESEAPYCTVPYKSIFYFTLYKSMDAMYHDAITMDHDGNVFASFEPDQRISYRFRFGFVIDLTLIDPAFWERLKKYPNAFDKIMDAIDEGHKNYPGIDQGSLDDRIRRRTVMGTFIIARDGERTDRLDLYKQGKIEL